MAKIVVGVNASPGALRELAWAAGEARRVVVIPSGAEGGKAAAAARGEPSEVLP